MESLNIKWNYTFFNLFCCFKEIACSYERRYYELLPFTSMSKRNNMHIARQQSTTVNIQCTVLVWYSASRHTNITEWGQTKE
jgi:hypothetical protein